ncbi:MAG: SGNH/GDSL hydrolase family protein [Treponema sp.]|nr:SGNH/GDSL hydrolase family protein [Treponema sp.]
MKKTTPAMAALGAAFVAVLMTVTACSSAPKEISADKGKTEAVKPAEKPAAPAKSENPLSIPDDVYATMLEKSIVAQGNNFRIKKFLEKIRSGEMVYVACIGGSVTEGAGPADFRDGYAYQFSKMLRTKYAPAGATNVTFDGAGLSGTSSPVGLVRYNQDVTNVLGADPDLLVIEFAVNDGGEPTKQRAFEQLIRNVLEAKPEAVVMAFYSAAKYPNTQTQMTMVASHYNIPQVSVQDAINNRQSSFTDEQYFTDIVHPTKAGHTIMADCLMNIIDLADKADADEAVPVPEDYRKRKNFKGFRQILGDDENVKITSGDFNGKDGQTQGLKKTNKGDFPNNWYHKPSAGNDALKMKINCKNLILVYKDFGSWAGVKAGKADIYVDGKLAQTVNGFTGSGWNNCVETIVIDEEEAAEHTVEVRMKEGDEDKAFTICGMGYSK